MKGIRLSMNAFRVDFWFLPPLPYQGQKLPWHLCKRCFRERSKEKGLFKNKKSLEEAQWADVSPILKNVMLKAQWRLAADALRASKQRVQIKLVEIKWNLQDITTYLQITRKMLIVQKLHENITRRMQKMQIYAKIHKIHEPLADESDKHI